MEEQAFPGEATQHATGEGCVLAAKGCDSGQCHWKGTLSHCPILQNEKPGWLSPGAGVTRAILPHGLLPLPHRSSHQIKGGDLGLSSQDLKPAFQL